MGTWMRGARLTVPDLGQCHQVEQILNAELVHDLGRWRAQVFGDYARGRAWHRPLPSDARNRKEVHGVGFGFDADLAEGLVLKAVLAARTSRPAAGNADRAVRAWVQLAKTF